MTRRNTREAWDIDPDQFPYTGDTARKVEHILRYAILAPSSHNTQPWRFRIHERHVELLVDRSRALPVIDPTNRQLFMSCGAALLNLRIAMRRFGWADVVHELPPDADADVLARIGIGVAHRPERSDYSLCNAIPLRRTNRQPFELRPVSKLIADKLTEACDREGAWLVRMVPAAKYAAAELIAAADREQLADRAFRQELSSWLVSNVSPRGDGIPGRSKSYGPTTSFGTRLWVRTFDVGGAVAAREHDLVAGSPMLAVLGTHYDDPIGWLRAGQAMQRMLLTAQTYGLSASFLNQPLELNLYRDRFRQLIGRPGIPQLIMRIGYGPLAPATPRRPLEDVVDYADGISADDVRFAAACGDGACESA